MLKAGLNRNKYGNLLTAYDLGKQNIESKRVTTKSKICLGHNISGKLENTVALRATISNVKTVLWFNALKIKGTQTIEPKNKLRILRNPIVENALKLCYP